MAYQDLDMQHKRLESQIPQIPPLNLVRRIQNSNLNHESGGIAKPYRISIGEFVLRFPDVKISKQV